MQRKVFVLFSTFILLVLLIAPLGTAGAQAQQTITGILNIRWGDGPSGSVTTYQIIADNKQTTVLQMDTAMESSGGVLTLNQKRVTVTGKWDTALSALETAPVFQAESINLADSPSGSVLQSSSVSAAVSGSQPWISIMCKFPDYPAQEPASLSYFQDMYSSTYPGLNHYWQEVSYNAINVLGSSAVGWYVLPQARSYYINNPNFLDVLAADCIAQADNDVYFPSYQGINMMFNYELDGFAWGGSQYLELDGVYGGWSTTWEPPWGYSDITVIAHEMGHGFGLPHSSGSYGQTYDNQWDVMSDTWSNCYRLSDPTYGCIGQHTIMFHKDILGWIPAGLKYTLNYSNADVSDAFNPGAYLMAEIPILGSGFNLYTVEARNNTVGYDSKLPGQGIIIHEIDYSRMNPAHVVDIDGNGNTGDAGAIWKVGETFTDLANNISVSVLAATTDGYQVSIQNGAQFATIEIGNSAQILPFVDVPLNYWAKGYVERLYAAGITGGCVTTPSLLYCPESGVTRAQMAIFLLKGIHGSGYVPPAVDAGTGFTDVPVDYWAAAWIKQLAIEGITSGCGDGNYCPETTVTRAQMSIFLLKAKYSSAYTPPNPIGVFTDVPVGYWADKWIEQLAVEGITSGCGAGTYCPDNSVTRAQMAVFLVKTFNLP